MASVIIKFNIMKWQDLNSLHFDTILLSLVIDETIRASHFEILAFYKVRVRCWITFWRGIPRRDTNSL